MATTDNATSFPSDDADLASVADRRFAGVSRLYGTVGLARLADARVAVVGLGGVGSWVVEACARSGIGHLTLFDLDHVSESNINRQSHALDSTVGAAKAAVMARRVADINPLCIVETVEDFVDADNVEALLPPGRYDFVVDAIDQVRAKTALIVHCHANGIPLVTIGGAGGRTDASRVRVTDLAHTLQEPMLAKVRKNLRTRHGFPRNVKKSFGIPAVFSDQPLRGNEAAIVVDSEGMIGLNCAGYGSVVSVTAVFGFVAAGLLIDRIARGK
ncbi:MAG: tRNA threonylcarbamoyladenosine dehydratase [Burkholderiaceae bacterium]